MKEGCQVSRVDPELRQVVNLFPDKTPEEVEKMRRKAAKELQDLPEDRRPRLRGAQRPEPNPPAEPATNSSRNTPKEHS